MRDQRKNIYFERRKSHDKKRLTSVWSQTSHNFTKFLPHVSGETNQKQILLQSIKNLRNMSKQSSSFFNWMNGQGEYDITQVKHQIQQPKVNKSQEVQRKILQFKMKKSTKTILSQIEQINKAKQIFYSFQGLVGSIKNIIIDLEGILKIFPHFQALNDKDLIERELKRLKQELQANYQSLSYQKSIENGFIKMIQFFMKQKPHEVSINQEIDQNQLIEIKNKLYNDFINVKGKQNSKKIINEEFLLKKVDKKFQQKYQNEGPVSLKEIKREQQTRKTCQSTAMPSQIQIDPRHLSPQKNYDSNCFSK